jgi:hypothetical protein
MKTLATLILAGMLMTACSTQSAPSAAQLPQQLSHWKAASGGAYLANARALVGDTDRFKADATAGNAVAALGDCVRLGLDVRAGRRLTLPPVPAAAQRFDRAYAALTAGANDCISFLSDHVASMGQRTGAAITRGLNLYLSAVNSLPAS